MSKLRFRNTMFTIIVGSVIMGMILTAIRANETVTFILFLAALLTSIFWVLEESQEW